MDITIHWDESAIAKLRAISAGMPDTLLRIVSDARNYVRARIMETKLSGQVLNRRTGTLMRSIQEGGGPATLESPTHAVAPLGTDLWYGRMWELEGHGEIVPIRAKVLHFVGSDGADVFTMRVAAQGPRPFIRPALEESQSAFQDIARRRMALALRGEGGA